MKTATFSLLAAFLAMATCCSSTAHAAPVTFDWVTVGNPGNTGDVQSQGTFGAVANAYRISKTEVTNTQYAEFLNAVDPAGANPLSLYSSAMSSNARGGINFNGGAANGFKYEIKTGRDNNPVVFVTFFDAIRFTNWLENGQGSGSTESGVYTIGNGLNEVRNPSATYFIPSEDEWYKAAYYDPNKSGGAGYYNYTAGTDDVPYSDNPASLNTPDDTNTANFLKYDSMANGYNDGFAVTGSASFVSSTNYLTDVGAYTMSLSPYGTYDQGGNVWEWNETVLSLSFRGSRGGGWSSTSTGLAASGQNLELPESGSQVTGFRVASIPEPSSMLLGAMAAVGLLLWRRVLS